MSLSDNGLVFIFLQLVLLLALAVFLFDLICAFWERQARIRIGKFQDRDRWTRMVLSKGLRWLNATPKVRISDNTRWVLADMLKGTFWRRAVQSWQEAALLLGLNAAYRFSKDPAIYAAIARFLNSKFNEKGGWKQSPPEVDVAMLAYAVMSLDGFDARRYKPAFDELLDMIFDRRGDDGTIIYRAHGPDYRFVDTLGLVCPFLALYGRKFQRPDCVDLAVKQITTFQENGLLQGSRIPFHAYKVSERLPLGIAGWGRGVAWYGLGLMGVWQHLPEGHAYKQILERDIVELSKTSLSFQNPNGSWNWTLTRREARADSSATAFFAWFLRVAAQCEETQGPCDLGSEKAVKYLMSVTRRTGEIDFSQGDTKDIGVYSQRFDILPFTQGFAIRCAFYRSTEEEC